MAGHCPAMLYCKSKQIGCPRRFKPAPTKNFFQKIGCSDLMQGKKQASFSETERLEWLQRTRQCRKIFARAMLLGVLSGFMGVLFRFSLQELNEARKHFYSLLEASGESGMVLIFCSSILATVIAACLVAVLAPEASGSGIPHLKANLEGFRTFRSFRLITVKFFSGLIGMGAGLTLGREGPTIQMCGALGRLLAKPSAGQEEARALMAAGGSAGVAVAFNAPLSGLMFVLEELQENCRSVVFFAAALACFSADAVCRAILGQTAVLGLHQVEVPAFSLMPVFIPLGILCGLTGVAFNKALLAGQKLVFLPMKYRLIYLIFWGLVIGATAWFLPLLLGGGEDLLKCLFDEPALPISMLAAYFLLRFFLTVGSYSTGTAGGLFAPVLVLGALLGSGFSILMSWYFPDLPMDEKVYTIAGMAGLMAGVVRAPLTGIMLMIEITGNYSLILPLFLTSFLAGSVADGLRNFPIYDDLLLRDLARNPPER